MAKIYGSEVEVNINKTCTVKVNSVDPICGFLDDKIAVVSPLTKSVKSGTNGLELEISIDSDQITTKGYDSELLNIFCIQQTEVSPDDSGHWNLNPMGNTTETRKACFGSLSYVGDQSMTIDYESFISKSLSGNLDNTKQFKLRIPYMLDGASNYVYFQIDLYYKDSSGAVQVKTIPNTLAFGTAVSDDITYKDFLFDLPDIIPETLILGTIGINDNNGDGVAQTSIQVGDATLYIPINNYPVTDSQI